MTATRPPEKRAVLAPARPTVTRSILFATPASGPLRPPEQPGAPSSEGPPDDTIPVAVVARDLSERLTAAEQELRHSWVDLLGVSSEAAERFSEASRYIHRARLLLDGGTLIR